MDGKIKLRPEDLEVVTGGNSIGSELDKDDINTLNELIIWGKYKGYSKDDFLVAMVEFGLSGESLWYLGTHWEEINR